MNEEIDAIVKAINGLHQETNYFKDYVFPIASAFFTSILGAAIAYITIKDQDFKSNERSKLNTANKWIVLVEEARANLLAIKSTYNDNLSDHPIHRMSNIKEIVFYANPITENYDTLSFIALKKKGDKLHKWGDIPRLRAMINNYNYLIKLWDERNKLYRNINQKILTNFGNGSGCFDISIENIIKCMGEADICALINITERAVKLTDDLIIEQNDFLINFPRHVRTLINTKKIKDYGAVLGYSNNGNEGLLKLLEKSKKPSFESVEVIFKMKKEEIEKMHFTGY
ncbi:hypothetical protein AYI92_03135 [Shewanella xiamenensis]|uniref:hypothetical protein n=1 Tax=Shewanella xiamenensis TaxID=332186 RepID=UPI0011869631|nr:hypothetical protein [Shewanella xiamenensis]TVL22753.1 hypothetical protein AYI90_03505 [Shewanella xiamenensis]TVL23096.1 hypothetical protein AYI91_04885 [Shewanella xiamenensis]TVL28449.1 hypothetical protein AYI92_03135 [Shewanella xiamenensis]TVL37024.1 hypothetical protein AYI93_04290 [Shewanella xiamenensis]TVP04674.1 hypothetical protein AYI89_04285 [Shewanella xiamenensis]